MTFAICLFNCVMVGLCCDRLGINGLEAGMVALFMTFNMHWISLRDK